VPASQRTASRGHGGLSAMRRGTLKASVPRSGFSRMRDVVLGLEGPVPASLAHALLRALRRCVGWCCWWSPWGAGHPMPLATITPCRAGDVAGLAVHVAWLRMLAARPTCQDLDPGAPALASLSKALRRCGARSVSCAAAAAVASAVGRIPARSLPGAETSRLAFCIPEAAEVHQAESSVRDVTALALHCH
jgi:hypothetical protein